ncbi:MAG: glycosyltransferase, partial [Anaerolineae bacterium]
FPVLEAQQCGTPVVAAERASLVEVTGEAGLLIDPEDPADIAEACLRIARDPALRAELREAGFQHAATFTWERAARETLAVYAETLGRR